MHRTLKKADGSVAIIVFATDDPKLIKRDTDNFLNDNPGAVVVGDDLPLPSNRRFRNCWTHEGGKVTPHMGKAREQRLNELRAERNKRLDESDKEMLKAQEQGKPTKGLADKRQALRDLPAVVAPQLDAIHDPDELAAFEPTWPA